jgi:ketol-acid reductoisomerase
MGGSNDPSNLVNLTVEEHAMAHLKLYNDHKNPYDLLAYEGLIKMKNGGELAAEASRIANTGKIAKPETLKKKSKAILKRIEMGLYTPPTNAGLPRTSEWRSRVSVAMKGNKNGLGTKRSEETKKKMSEAQQRRFGSI